MNDRRAPTTTARRLLLAALTLATTGCGCWAFEQVLSTGHHVALAIALRVLFLTLFILVAFSFWMATAGFLRLLAGRRVQCPTPHESASHALASTGKTAILMPIYNESPHRVFAGLRAIYESLQVTGHGTAFDFFILSDTTDPDLWLAEELAWARLNQAVTGASSVYYRHRPKNIARKAGNIADFCERWGSAYRYMIVLDADSVMSGETIVELIRRMDQDPQIGILQAPIVPANRLSVFARCQQFSACVYGPVFLEGFAWWANVDGNYWGHNAVIRVEPFTKHCGLGKLPGVEPLGGEILSHDFVEAALMRRAGFKVCLAHDLQGGSYEECPPTLIAFAQRDQRWCQGNMQHVRLVFSAGLHPVSRLHLGMGAMSYLSSPLWMLFLVLSFVSSLLAHGTATQPHGSAFGPQGYAWAAGLFATTMGLLLLPKLWGYLTTLLDRRRRAECGGAFKMAISVLLETLASMLVAPIMMAFHGTFVVLTLLGRRVHWTAQDRDEQGQPLAAAIATHWKQTVLGAIGAVAVWLLAPDTLVWLSPVLAGLILAIPLSILLSSVMLGQALARRGLLLTPEETAVPMILQRQRHLLALPPSKELNDFRGMFRRILADPAFIALHRCILRATDASITADVSQIRLTQRQLLAGGPARVSVENRKAILSDPLALSALHLFAWTSRRKGEPEVGEA
jgi:membrane glycosyltransferase